MRVPSYTSADLKQLPLRAIVAFVARCARRVEHLAIPPQGHPAHDRCAAAVIDTIQSAEDFATNRSRKAYDSVITSIEACRDAVRGDLVREDAMAAIVGTAHTVAVAAESAALAAEPEEHHLFGPPTRPFAHLADLTADLTALDAYTAAVHAFDASGYAEHFIQSSLRDYEALLHLKLGQYPEPGNPVDPSPGGPLGPI